jgi:hypothetical protein
MKSFFAALTMQLTAFTAGAEAAPDAVPEFAAAPALSSDVFKAARFAAHDRKVRLLGIQSAEPPTETHVSYRLCLLVRGDGGRFRAAAEIARGGFPKLALTRWYPGGC